MIKNFSRAMWLVVSIVVLAIIAGCLSILYAFWRGMMGQGGPWSAAIGIALGLVMIAVMFGFFWFFFLGNRFKKADPKEAREELDDPETRLIEKGKKEKKAPPAAPRDFEWLKNLTTLAVTLVCVIVGIHWIYIESTILLTQPVHDTEKAVELTIQKMQAQKATAPVTTGLLRPGDASQAIPLKKGGYKDTLYYAENPENNRLLAGQKTMVRYKIDGKWEEHWKTLGPDVRNWTTTQYIQEVQFVNKTNIAYTVEVRFR